AGVTEGRPEPPNVWRIGLCNDYSGGRLASRSLTGLEEFSTWQEAQPALPVGRDDRTQQSPAALEINNADDTRIGCHEVPSLWQSGAAHPRGILHDTSEVVAVEWRRPA